MSKGCPLAEGWGRAQRGLMARRGPWSWGGVQVGGTAPRHALHSALQMAQELGISEKSPDYRNPFKTDHSEVRQQCCWLAPWASLSRHGFEQPAGEGNG